jgi:hypothetical protein
MNKALLALTVVLAAAVVVPSTASAQLPYLEQEPVYRQASAPAQARPMEMLSLNFTKITYTPA